MVMSLGPSNTVAQRLQELSTAELVAICQNAPQRWSSNDIAATCVLHERCGVQCIFDPAVLRQIARCRRLPVQIRDEAIGKLVVLRGSIENIPDLKVNNFINGYAKRHPEKPRTQD